MILFIALMGYLVYFTTVKAKTFVNSPYNQRQDSFAQSVVRGDITDRNGNVLATTEVDEDGTETRTYPYGSLFSHVIGYNDSQFGKTGLESAQNFDLLTSNAFFMEKKFEVSEFALEAVRHFEFSGTLINVRPFGNGHINDTYLAEYDILIMDEPLQGLDAETKEKVATVIKMQTAGKTVLFVTHDEKEAEFFEAECMELV